LIEYAVNYYKNLLTKYSKGKERKTEIRTFDVITATKVAANNQKLYINRAEGFIGYGLKKDEYIADCSDIDDIIVFMKDGKFKVVKIAEKVFVGKDIIHAEVFNKDDERKVYNAAYLDGEAGVSYVKRFQVGGITRDRENDITRGTKHSKLWYFTANPNGEAETITVQLTPACKAKIKVFDFDFATLAIKGRSAQGNILTKYPVRNIKFKMAGGSTLGGLNIYYDNKIGRLNTEERGIYLGSFQSDDKILALYTDGSYQIMNADLTNRYEIAEVVSLHKFDPKAIISAVYFDGEHESFYIKRFAIETTTVGKAFSFITEHKKSKLYMATVEEQPQIKINYTNEVKKEVSNIYDVDLLTEVRGWKALGTKLPQQRIKSVQLVSSEEGE
ncbi:MAG: DNA gyrase/topoisomerase IV subunit A, partial [Thermoflexibacter sp.]|nr:DNA gyrase/topoisomerase IV subunit A [Thermoflexibacter sp.]